MGPKHELKYFSKLYFLKKNLPNFKLERKIVFEFFPNKKISRSLLLFRKLLAALKKKKLLTFRFVDFVATIMTMMLFSLRARHCKYFGTKDFSNKKITRNKQREKQEFCTKPKNSKTAKTM